MTWKLLKSLPQYILMLLGLSGLVDGLVEWQGYMENIVQHYQNARDFVFGLLGLEFHPIFKDYLVIGSGICAAYVSSGESPYIWYYENMSVGLSRVIQALYAALVWSLWPAFLFLMLFLGLILVVQTGDSDPEKHHFAMFWLRLSITIVVFVAALFLFTDASSKLF